MHTTKMMLSMCLLLDINKVTSFATIHRDDHAQCGDITQNEIEHAQIDWGNAIKGISAVRDGTTDEIVAEAKKHLDDLYAYPDQVSFKPTKAATDPFRPSYDGALSYFVGAQNGGVYAEDGGFALGPGGAGYSVVTLRDHQVSIMGKTALAMGEYFFTTATGTDAGKVTKVEYTFGYKRAADCRVVIYLHHSSLPWPCPEGKECN